MAESNRSSARAHRDNRRAVHQVQIVHPGWGFASAAVGKDRQPARGQEQFSGSVAGSTAGGHGFYLHELVGEPEDAEAEQRARRSAAAEALLDLIPCDKEVSALPRRHVDRRLHDILQATASRAQGNDQVLQRSAGLAREIAWGDHAPFRVDGTRASREDGAPGRRDRRIGVRDASVERGSVDERSFHKRSISSGAPKLERRSNRGHTEAAAVRTP
jgi:hypothetical protein